MRTFFYYSLETGVILPRAVQTNSEKVAEMNKPAGYGLIEGVTDWKSQRVDTQTDTDGIVTRTVVDYQPPQPSEDHEWNPVSKRWEIKIAVQETRRERLKAINDIESLELKQLRPSRELQLDPTNVDAKLKLEEIEAEIIVARAKLGRP